MKRTELSITNNPLTSKKDVADAVRQLCEPLRDHFSPGRALVHLGETGTVYPERTALMEAFARPLWGLAPLMAGGGDTDLLDFYREGLANGTDPKHDEYWGPLGDIDQLAVEMPPLALGFCLAPEKLWEPLGQSVKDNIFEWFDQINHNEVCDNNWLFFPIFVNIAFKKLGLPYSQELLDNNLKVINSFYLGDGWSTDGVGAEPCDYYLPFAIHYYSLIYSVLMGKEDPDRCAVFKERAKQFAQDFVYWFAPDGSALPFGRSLTYRFAQGSFWGACAFANLEALDWGIMKGLYLRHLRWWFSQPIFDSEGILSIGYRYSNLVMAEFYNGPGSPYWAFKAFLPLALADDHPFWQAEEKPLPPLDDTVSQVHPHMILCRDDAQNHVFALTSGQWAGFEPTHVAEKYAKFAYSNQFGFSVSSESSDLEKGAFDSMLALSEDGRLWRARRTCESVTTESNAVISVWKPWDDVEIRTWLVAANPWHIRVHRISTGRKLMTAEGGFAIRSERDLELPDSDWQVVDKDLAFCDLPWGASGIVNLEGQRESTIILAAANTNLLYPRTVIPTLTGELDVGESWIACAVLGVPERKDVATVRSESPTVREKDGTLVIELEGEAIYRIDLCRGSQQQA